MMFFFLCIYWACFACASDSPEIFPKIPVNILFLDEVAHKTLALTRNGPKGDSYHNIHCAAVIIDKNLALTAAHCVKKQPWCTIDNINIKKCDNDPKEKEVVFYYTYVLYDHGFLYYPNTAIIIKKNINSDLALLFLMDDMNNVARISKTNAPSGQKAHIISHPMKKPYSYLDAHVRTYFFMREGMHVMSIDEQVNGGTSGGGAWNDSGELIGICASRSTTINESYFISIETIRKFLTTD